MIPAGPGSGAQLGSGSGAGRGSEPGSGTPQPELEPEQGANRDPDPQPDAAKALPSWPHRFDPTILREYDIRGVVGDTLHAADAYALGRAFAAVVREAGGQRVVVGYDGRLSSPMLEAALVDGLTAGGSAGGSDGGAIETGVDVVRIGMGPTPMLYYAEASAQDVQGGIQVTGSHNPADHNGFKMVLGGLPFFGADIQWLGAIAQNGGSCGTGGGVSGSGYGAGGQLAETIHADGTRPGAGPIASARTDDVRSGASEPDDRRTGGGQTGQGQAGDAHSNRGAVAARQGGNLGVTGSGAIASAVGLQVAFGATAGSIGQDTAADATGDAGAGAAAGRERCEGVGRREQRDVLEAYVTRLLAGLTGIDAGHLSALAIGWDAGNGAAGPALERLTARLPGKHHLLHCEVDGTFPNHHPDPTVEANLADLRALVAGNNLDFGVAFDGDADRIGVVDGLGRVIWGDQLLTIYAQDVLARAPGAIVIGDVKASQAVFDEIARLGGVPLMAPAGHSHIKSRMKETGALLGGETSGHVFLADDYYGFDDGLYAAVRLIAASARLGTSVTALRGAMPDMLNTPELRFAVADARKFAAIEEVHGRLVQGGAEPVAIDGVRVTTPDGWWLLRASNTQPALTARAESNTPAGLERLVAEIDRQLALSGLDRGVVV